MEFWVSLLRKVLSIEKRTTSGHCSTMESSADPFFHSAWLQAISMTSPTPCSEATTHHRSWVERKDSKLSKTTQETTNRISEIGPLTSMTSVTIPRLWRVPRAKVNVIRQLLILEARSWQFLPRSTKNYKTNGLNRSLILTANQTQLSATPNCNARILLKRSVRFISKLTKRCLK